MSIPPMHTKPWTWVPWALSLTGNTLLGYAGIFPFSVLVTFLRGTVLDDLGWVDNAPSLRDNTYLFAVIGILGTALILALFRGYNKRVSRKLTVAARPYWIVSSFMLLAPAILVAVWPGLWQLIKFY